MLIAVQIRDNAEWYAYEHPQTEKMTWANCSKESKTTEWTNEIQPQPPRIQP